MYKTAGVTIVPASNSYCCISGVGEAHVHTMQFQLSEAPESKAYLMTHNQVHTCAVPGRRYSNRTDTCTGWAEINVQFLGKDRNRDRASPSRPLCARLQAAGTN